MPFYKSEKSEDPVAQRRGKLQFLVDEMVAAGFSPHPDILAELEGMNERAVGNVSTDLRLDDLDRMYVGEAADKFKPMWSGGEVEESFAPYGSFKRSFAPTGKDKTAPASRKYSDAPAGARKREGRRNE